jgi:hypothetical protein
VSTGEKPLRRKQFREFSQVVGSLGALKIAAD